MSWKKGNRLPLVTEATASGRTLDIFHEIKQALGIPFVSLAFEVYAAFPVFFNLHWQTMRSMAATHEFFNLAQRLRADIYTRAFNYLSVPDFRPSSPDETARQELSSAIELFHYADSLTLLLVTAQFQSFEAPVGQVEKSAERPAEHPVFSDAPAAIAESCAPAATRRTLDELKRASGLPSVSYEDRVLARWPEFLNAYLSVLKPLLQSPLYEGCSNAVRDTAFALTREFPQPVDLSLVHLAEAGISDDDLASLARITEMLVDALSTRLLNLSVAKIGLEGGTAPQAEERKPAAAHGKDRAA
jgi:hypothetical protein